MKLSSKKSVIYLSLPIIRRSLQKKFEIKYRVSYEANKRKDTENNIANWRTEILASFLHIVTVTNSFYSLAFFTASLFNLFLFLQFLSYIFLKNFIIMTYIYMFHSFSWPRFYLFYFRRFSFSSSLSSSPKYACPYFNLSSFWFLFLITLFFPLLHLS